MSTQDIYHRLSPAAPDSPEETAKKALVVKEMLEDVSKTARLLAKDSQATPYERTLAAMIYGLSEVVIAQHVALGGLR